MKKFTRFFTIFFFTLFVINCSNINQSKVTEKTGSTTSSENNNTDGEKDIVIFPPRPSNTTWQEISYSDMSGTSWKTPELFIQDVKVFYTYHVPKNGNDHLYVIHLEYSSSLNNETVKDLEPYWKSAGKTNSENGITYISIEEVPKVSTMYYVKFFTDEETHTKLRVQGLIFRVLSSHLLLHEVEGFYFDLM